MHLGMCLIASVSSSNALDFCLYKNVVTDPSCLKGVFFARYRIPGCQFYFNTLKI